MDGMIPRVECAVPHTREEFDVTRSSFERMWKWCRARSRPSAHLLNQSLATRMGNGVVTPLHLSLRETHIINTFTKDIDTQSSHTIQFSDGNNESRDLTAATETATNSEYHYHRKAKRIAHTLIEAFQLEHQWHITFHPTAHHLFLHLFQISLTNTATRLPPRLSPATKLPNLPLPPRSQDQPFRHRNPKSRLASC